MLSGNWTFLKELVGAYLIAFNYTSHKYQNGFKNLLFHFEVYACELELFYMELCRWEGAAGKKALSHSFCKENVETLFRVYAFDIV